MLKHYYVDLHNFLSAQGDVYKILMGDFNQMPNAEEIQEIQTHHTLSDVFAQQHPHIANFPTHKQGSQRIDYFLVSTELIPHIKRIGYESFHMGIPSDHRGMYMDITTEVFQGQTLPPARHITSHYGNQAKKYRKFLVDRINKANIVKRLRRLLQKQDWSHQEAKQLQSLDHELSKHMLTAEKKVTPAHTAPWSSEIHQAYTKVRKLETNGNTERSTDKQQEKTQEIQRLIEARKNGAQQRPKYLEERAEIQELKGQHNRAAIIKNIIKSEDIRQIYGHIKYSNKPQETLDLIQVTFPTTTGWRVTKSPEELEEKILQQQEEHFAQANYTPVARVTNSIRSIERELFTHFEKGNIPDKKI